MNKLTTSIAAAALAATFSLAAVAPASADQAAVNRNEILGGLALVAGVATAINVANKNAEANAYPYGDRYDGRNWQNDRNDGRDWQSNDRDHRDDGDRGDRRDRDDRR